MDAIQQYAKRYPKGRRGASPLGHDFDSNFVFSISSYKRRALNHHLLERFIDKLGLEPTFIKSHPNYSDLYNYGTIAS